MTLYIIGIGLEDEKDITVKGLEAIKTCTQIYLENYTSLLQCTKESLEKFYNKPIILADRDISEQGAEKIVEQAKTENVAFLVIGDPFSATTHVELFKLAKEQGIEVNIINNASILTAISITGLQLYKFGKTTSIPFLEDHPNLETPYKVFKENKEKGLHTLFLLDLKPEEKKFMTVNDALTILEKIEEKRKENLITKNLLVVGCARLGTGDCCIKAGKLETIKKLEFGSPPHCLIIPGKLHFHEEEVLDLYRA